MTEYFCPVDRNVYMTLGGWKRHMTAAHRGYTETMLRDAVNLPTATTKERMEAFAESMPESVLGAPGAPSGDEEPASPPPGPIPAPGPRVRRIRATPKKAKRILTKIPERFFSAQGIELDEEDKEGLAEAVEFLEDIFGLEFEIPEEKYVVRSRVLALLWPLAIMLLIWAKHRLKFVWPETEEEAEERVINAAKDLA